MTRNEFSPKTQQVLAAALALVIGGMTFSAMPLHEMVSARKETATTIDFRALHREASDALDRLHRPRSPGAF